MFSSIAPFVATFVGGVVVGVFGAIKFPAVKAAVLAKFSEIKANVRDSISSTAKDISDKVSK